MSSSTYLVTLTVFAKCSPGSIYHSLFGTASVAGATNVFAGIQPLCVTLHDEHLFTSWEHFRGTIQKHLIDHIYRAGVDKAKDADFQAVIQTARFEDFKVVWSERHNFIGGEEREGFSRTVSGASATDIWGANWADLVKVMKRRNGMDSLHVSVIVD